MKPNSIRGQHTYIILLRLNNEDRASDVVQCASIRKQRTPLTLCIERRHGARVFRQTYCMTLQRWSTSEVIQLWTSEWIDWVRQWGKWLLRSCSCIMIFRFDEEDKKSNNCRKKIIIDKIYGFCIQKYGVSNPILLNTLRSVGSTP